MLQFSPVHCHSTDAPYSRPSVCTIDTVVCMPTASLISRQTIRCLMCAINETPRIPCWRNIELPNILLAWLPLFFFSVKTFMRNCLTCQVLLLYIRVSAWAFVASFLKQKKLLFLQGVLFQCTCRMAPRTVRHWEPVSAWDKDVDMVTSGLRSQVFGAVTCHSDCFPHIYPYGSLLSLHICLHVISTFSPRS